MKQRIISSLIGLVVLVIAIFFYHTILFNLVMAAVSLIAVFELLKAIKMLQYKWFAVLGALLAGILPFVQHKQVRPWVPLIVFVLLVFFVILVIKHHSTVTFEQASTALLISILVPLFFSSAVYVRDRVGYTLGLYYLLLALGSAWFCDTGAYFAGYFFGKRKMAPNISPKKTVEGAIGGIITATVLNTLLAVGYAALVSNVFHTPITIQYGIVALVSPFLAGLGMLGDLMASTIKRQHDVKDFGHIMPGHGGIMDRFDSVLLTLPAVYVLILYVPILAQQLA